MKMDNVAIGAVQVTMQSAHLSKSKRIGSWPPNPFVSIGVGNSEETFHTGHRRGSYDPHWNETKFLLVNSLNELLHFRVYDYNEHRKDTFLGSATFELSKLQQRETQLRATLLKKEKDKGELRFEVAYFPALKPEQKETAVGIVRLIVHEAMDLDSSKSPSGVLKPLVKVALDDNEAPTQVTQPPKSNNPIWESAHDFLSFERRKSVVTVTVIDDFIKDSIGYMSILLEDLLESKQGCVWWPLNGCKSGRLRLSVEWKPLDMARITADGDQYSPPIGVVRLWLQSAAGPKDAQVIAIDKNDAYVRVQVNGVTKARTNFVNSSMNPFWDHIIYVPVHSLKEILLLEYMNYRRPKRNRCLGSADLRVSELAKESGDIRLPYQSIGRKTVPDPFHLNKANAYEENMQYTALFIPALPLKGATFDNQAKNQPEDGMNLDKEALLAQQSGIIVFNVLSGSVAKMAPLEVFLDDGYWPAFNTTKSVEPKGNETVESGQVEWKYIGEGFLKELDVARVWPRLNEANEGARDKILGEWKGDAKALLRLTLDKPRKIPFFDDEGGVSSVIQIEARYIPVPVALEPRESVHTQGILRVVLLDGREFTGGDLRGNLDPFAIFSFNGQKVFKSQTKKKTAAPEWNENFVLSVPSLVIADLSVEIFDWKKFAPAKSIGAAKIKLDLEPFQSVQRDLHLVSTKHGAKGHILVRLLFQPQIIAKSQGNSWTFWDTCRSIIKV